MNLLAMNNISYGVYVLTATNGSFSNGCIINTLVQVTASPNRVAVTMNKTDYTHYMIQQSGEFNVSSIDETADFSLISHFGFVSGRWTNKFYDYASKRAENGIPYVTRNVNAFFCCKVVKQIDLGTHTMFIADVVDCNTLSDKPSMTYGYYHKHVKPKHEDKKDGKIRWVCTVCGYIHEGELPSDFICPLCKHGVEAFKRL